MKFESAINICQSNCGILHLSPLHLCKDMHSFDVATMPGCNFSILIGILCDYPQNRSSKIAVPCRGRCFSVPCRAASCRAASYRSLPCHALPCRVLLCPAMHCRTMPCYVMSCRTVSCPMSVMPRTC